MIIWRIKICTRYEMAIHIIYSNFKQGFKNRRNVERFIYINGLNYESLPVSPIMNSHSFEETTNAREFVVYYIGDWLPERHIVRSSQMTEGSKIWLKENVKIQHFHILLLEQHPSGTSFLLKLHQEPVHLFWEFQW